MTKLSRRETLARGGQAVAAAAAMTTLPSIALGAEQDAELFAHVEEFWAAHKVEVDSHEKWVAEHKRVEALPECPPFVAPVENREAYERHCAFVKDHGMDALADASNEANERQGRAVKLVFDTPAKTYQGVLAKLKIVELAYGNGDGGDMDVDAYQDLDAPWLENVIADFERLAGRAI